MTDLTSSQLKTRAARDREAVLTRLSDARTVIIGTVAAATCALAAFIAATSPARSSVQGSHTPAPVPLSLDGGGSGPTGGGYPYQGSYPYGGGGYPSVTTSGGS